MGDFSVFQIAANMRRQRAEAAARADAAKAAEARRAEFARLTAADMAPENDPELVAALRAAADPSSSRFAHLAAPLMRYEAEMKTSEVQAAIRLAGRNDPPGGTAGFVLATVEKFAQPDAFTKVPDANSKNRAEATAARVLAAFAKAHERNDR